MTIDDNFDKRPAFRSVACFLAISLTHSSRVVYVAFTRRYQKQLMILDDYYAIWINNLNFSLFFSFSSRHPTRLDSEIDAAMLLLFVRKDMTINRYIHSYLDLFTKIQVGK